MAKPIHQSLKDHPNTLLVGVYTPYNQIDTPEYYYEEFLSLIKTLKVPYDHTHFTKVRAVDNNLFFTKGKLEDFIKICQENSIEKVYFSEPLSPLQARNLENAAHVTITDREGIILEIFKQAAHSSEGKIQVEMAEIEYLKTRIIGRGHELAQQAGMIGQRGPGETLKEEVKRHFAEKIRQARKRLETLERSRDVQRQRRLNSKMPLVCIIGYTNAGKSSLLNRMTHSNILAEDKLFATLDTTTRELFVQGKGKVLVSDTVGFISQLPPHLIEAFHSTLVELKYANLLLHVIDISNPAWKSQIEVVAKTLKDLGVDKPMFYVFNKLDKLDDETRENLAQQVMFYQPQLFIHTMSKDGIEPLISLLKECNF